MISAQKSCAFLFRYWLVLSVVLAGISADAQDTIYYNDQWKKINSYEDYDYQCFITYASADSSRANEKCIRPDGSIYCEKNYSDYSIRRQDGTSKTWYRDGTPHTDVNYRKGNFDSTLKSYWPNGVLKREDLFDNGTLIRGSCFDSSGVEVNFYAFEQMPEFPGGQDAMIQYLKREVNYPKKAKRKGITGKVFISFVIDKTGNVTDVRILRSVDPLLDEEAKRVVQGMPAWSPGMYDGEPVKVQYNLPIKFSLN